MAERSGSNNVNRFEMSGGRRAILGAILCAIITSTKSARAEDKRIAEAKIAFDAALAMWDQSPSPMIDLLLRRALSLHEAAGTATDRMAARIRNRIGRNAYNGGSFVIAEQMFRGAVRLATPDATRTDLEFAAYLGDLAAALREQQRYAEAWSPVCRSLAIRREAGGPNDPLVAASLNNMGRIALGEGRAGEAYALMKDAYEINLRAYGESGAAMRREAAALDHVRQLARGIRIDIDPCGAPATS